MLVEVLEVLESLADLGLEFFDSLVEVHKEILVHGFLEMAITVVHHEFGEEIVLLLTHVNTENFLKENHQFLMSDILKIIVLIHY